MNHERIAEIRRLAEAATKGPWEPCGCRFSIVTAQITPQETMDICDTKINDAISCEQAEANNCFISAARSAVPALLDALDEAERNDETITSNLIDIIAPQCPEHESHFKRISLSDFIEKYPRRCAECERLERVAIEAENAALKARVAVLEKVREAAVVLVVHGEGVIVQASAPVRHIEFKPGYQMAKDALEAALNAARGE